MIKMAMDMFEEGESSTTTTPDFSGDAENASEKQTGQEDECQVKAEQTEEASEEPEPQQEEQSCGQSETEEVVEEQPVEESAGEACEGQTAMQNVSDERLEAMAKQIADTADTAACMNQKVDKVATQLDAVQKRMETLAGYEKAVSTLERAVDTLKVSLAANQHNEENLVKELAIYKKDSYFTNIRPFLEFMVGFDIEIKDSKKQYVKDKDDFIANSSEEVYEEIIQLHDYFLGQLENQLEIQGVSIVTYEPETDFISGEQMVSRPVFTDDAGKVGKVAAVDSECYMYQDKVLRKSKVQVYRMKA